MVRSRPVPRWRVTLLAAILSAALPASGWTWGGATHHYIAQNYSQHLPAYIDGLRAYDSVVDLHVTDPDTRKPYTPGEGERHYIDIDAYPEFLSGTLPRERAALEAVHGAATVLDNGVLPWATGEVVATLTQQFQARQWSAAATTIADLCHYVADASQPLHCTENYDGQLSGNDGIHSRHESTMMSIYLAELDTPPMATAYHPSARDAMFDLIAASWAGVLPILQADDTARQATAGEFNATYYALLWSGTENLTRDRVDTATVITASLVYTAWADAGRPTVPGSSEADPELGPPAGAHLEVAPTPFRDEVTVRFGGTGPLSVEVFDVRGARVARLVAGASGAGSVSWRPARAGRHVGPGLYFVRLSGPGLNLVRRITHID